MSRIDASSLLAMRSAILQQNAALSRAAGVPAAASPQAAAAGFTGAMQGLTDALTGAKGVASSPQVAPDVASVGGGKRADFTSSLKQALSDVNDLQAKAGEASEAYERGETTDIAAVMLARETANIGFQATLQVRNKLLAAYKDIMSMPV